MALVAYGSDSDSDYDYDYDPGSDSDPKRVKSSVQDSKSTTVLNSQPSSLPPLPPKRNKPTRARILLDLPPPTSSSSSLQPISSPLKRLPSNPVDQHTNQDLKKPKLSIGPTNTSGLASILPPPKRVQIPPTSQPTTTVSNRQPCSLTAPSASSSSAAHHHSTPPDLPQSSRSPSSSSSSSAPAPPASSSGLNLFGLPSTLQAPDLRVSTVSATSSTISSAPQVADEVPPPPSLLDPYPGYWQRANGQWCARDADEPVWRAFRQKHYDASEQQQVSAAAHPSLPKDFFKDAPPGGSGLIEEFDAAKVARLAWESKPKVIDPREEARKEQAAAAAAKPAKQISARARGRHQLSSLLTEAQANRAELEDRISRGKFNRKAGGAKYGF